MFFKYVRRHKHFLLNVTSGSVLLAFGDIFAQLFYERKSHLDDKRLMAACVTGTALGYEAHIWYRFLDAFLAQTSWKSVFKKVLLDQTIAAPIYTTTYIIGSSWFEGRRSIEELKNDTKTNFFTLYLADCAVFIPVQIINFKYVSAYYRVPFMFAISFLFNTFLSAYKHSSHKDE